MSIGEGVVGWLCKAIQNVACSKNVSLPMQVFGNIDTIMNQEGGANSLIAKGEK